MLCKLCNNTPYSKFSPLFKTAKQPLSKANSSWEFRIEYFNALVYIIS